MTEETLTPPVDTPEEKFAADMGRIMSGVTSLVDDELVMEDGVAVKKSRYDFDESFQRKLVALILTDTEFNRSAEGLVDPAYFENSAHASLVSIGLNFFKRYKTTPSMPALQRLVKHSIESKLIRKDIAKDVIDIMRSLRDSKEEIADRDYVVDEIETFARHQAMSAAAYELINLLEKQEFDRAYELIKKANEVGKSSDSHSYNYFDEVDSRTERRKEVIAGILPPTGISSGYPDFDKFLHHKGWGRKELAVFMGGPKSGKSTALADFAKNASLQGYNALYVTLEVSSDIISSRIDANISDMLMSEIASKPIEVQNRVRKMSEKAGILMVEERPSGSMTPSELNRIIQKHKKDGIIFDLVAVDYADIMAPERYTQDAQENSKSIYVDIRAIAQRENVAMLTATQTNREGAKSSVARMEHVAEDFNKIRIADLVISINKTEDEKKLGVARLFFAASRNQAGDFTVKVNQDQARMKFITSIVGDEEGGVV